MNKNVRLTGSIIMKHDHTIKLLNQERDEQFRLRLEVEEERDMLADENMKMAEYLLYLNDCNKIPLERDGFGWLLHDKEKE